VAKCHGKTPAQILLRHQVQNGIIVIPKSAKKERIAENFDLWDFCLTEDEMAEMDGLDQGSAARTFPAFFYLTFDKDAKTLKDFPFTGKDEY
jgi:alcohol dehydrogenase (NADP+)